MPPSRSNSAASGESVSQPIERVLDDLLDGVDLEPEPKDSSTLMH